MKTNFDLFLSAQGAAIKLVDVKSPHEVHVRSEELFTEDGNDQADWTYWHQAFTQQRTYLAGLLAQKSESQKLLDAEAAKAAAELKKAAIPGAETPPSALRPSASPVLKPTMVPTESAPPSAKRPPAPPAPATEPVKTEPNAS